MNTLTKMFQVTRTITLSLAVVFSLSQCSEEEILADQPVTEDTATAMASETADVASISVAGVYTEITGDVNCATCTYVVGTGETTVDGKELGFKSGSVICLRKTLKYSAIDFVNMEGTEENPIVIGYCAE